MLNNLKLLVVIVITLELDDRRGATAIHFGDLTIIVLKDDRCRCLSIFTGGGDVVILWLRLCLQCGRGAITIHDYMFCVVFVNFGFDRVQRLGSGCCRGVRGCGGGRRVVVLLLLLLKVVLIVRGGGGGGGGREQYGGRTNSGDHIVLIFKNWFQMCINVNKLFRLQFLGFLFVFLLVFKQQQQKIHM